MSSAVDPFVHALHKHSQKCPAQKVGHPGLLHPIPMIQPPLPVTKKVKCINERS